MVSIFSGALSRTWIYENSEGYHNIKLFHDTITGFKSVLINNDEVEFIFHEVYSSVTFGVFNNYQLYFTAFNSQCCIHIIREGILGFRYECNVGQTLLIESTQTIINSLTSCNNKKFELNIKNTCYTISCTPSSTLINKNICWYYFEVKRLSDNTSTRIHRRFRDFAALNSQIKQSLKGHHLLSSLPDFPEKQLKIATDHNDPEFISLRSARLQSYLSSLVCMPYVQDMLCLHIFLGLQDNVREVSFIYEQVVLGISFQPSQCTGVPALVGSVTVNVVV